MYDCRVISQFLNMYMFFRTTGAGGANVLEYTGLLDKLYPEAFTSFPYQNKLEKESAQTMTLAWRQMIRNGGTEKYVEDIGIKSSHVFKPTIEDFFGKSNTQSQLSRIAEILHIQGQITGRRDMYFSATPTGLEDVNINGKSEFGIEVSGLDKISLKDGSGVEIGHTPASRTRLNQKEKLTLEPKEPASKIGMFRYEIQASRADQLYLKTYRTIRVIPSLEDRYHIAKNESFVWDFTIGNGTAVYNNFGLPDRDGWHIDEKNKLRLGDGQSYAPRVQSIISWFFTVAPDVRRMAFHITASYDTEEKADFFNCGYKDKKDKVHWIYDSGLSGSGMYNHHLDVWNVGTGFEAFCLFTSDDFLSGRGVAVSSIQMIPSKWIF